MTASSDTGTAEAPMADTVVRTDDTTKRRAAIDRGAALLRRGELVVFPTETVYGLGAAVTADERGLRRLREVKGRPADRPFTVHMPDPASADRYVDAAQRPGLQRLLSRTMPGPITVVVEVEPTVIEGKLAGLGFDPGQRHLLYGGEAGAVGLRCPADAVASELLRAVEAPVVASSANRSSDPPPHDAEMARRAMEGEAAMILDGGRARYGKPSTVVKVDGDDAMTVLREGVFDERYLRKLMMRNLLFVCSGNTCRSPMAEVIAREELGRRLNVPDTALERANWQVGSAGAFAAAGSPATPEAWRALERLGINPPMHRSQPLTAEMIRQADAVYCMTETHRQAAVEIAPEAADRIDRLDPDADIEDPIGSDERVYVDIAERLRTLIGRRIDQLLGEDR